MDLLYIEEDYRQGVAADHDHEAACCKAIQHCMDKGATQSHILKLVDSKAPMAVWEKAGQYAIRTVGEVKRERKAAKESSAGISR